MKIKAFHDDRTFTLTYVVHDDKTRDAVVIDPVLDYDPVGSFTSTQSVDAVSEYVRDHGLRVHYVLETHAHADHITGAQLLRRRFDAKVVIGKSITTVQETFKGALSLEHLATDGSQFDQLLEEGSTLEAGTLRIEAIATPGHTPACMTYRIDDALFTGDLIFMEDYGTGRCDFPKGSAEDMYDSIQKLYALPDTTRVFPGHDYPPAGRGVRWETTIGAEKAHNPQCNVSTSRSAFVTARNERDATLRAPALLFQSVQVNVDAGRMPPLRGTGRYFNLPVNLFRPADELGEPLKR